jgi:hypothetical protein
MIGWLNDINRLVSKDKREPRVIPPENTHTYTHTHTQALPPSERQCVAGNYEHISGNCHHHWKHGFITAQTAYSLQSSLSGRKRKLQK